MLKRRFLPLAGLLMLTILPAVGFLPAAEVDAQAPPTIGMVIYGDAPSGTVKDQRITALVTLNGKTTACGSGQVIDSGGLKFVVRIRPSSALTGCGETGATVQLFFSAANGNPGRFSNPGTAWQIGPKQVTLTLGDALPVRGRVASAARDGVN